MVFAMEDRIGKSCCHIIFLLWEEGALFHHSCLGNFLFQRIYSAFSTLVRAWFSFVFQVQFALIFDHILILEVVTSTSNLHKWNSTLVVVAHVQYYKSL